MTVPYNVGIDVGTSRVAAATARPTPDGSLVVARVVLGHRHDTSPAVVFVTDDGSLLFGDTAERRGMAEPQHLVREFIRNVGDDVPLSVAGRSVDAPHLLARTVVSVIAAAEEAEATAAAGVALTVPSAWGPHRTGLVRAALSDVGLPDVALMSEAEAAARNYGATHPWEDGRSVVVYDLGGTSFHAAVIRRTGEDTFSTMGHLPGIDTVGGADFDDLVFRHVLRSAGAEPAAMTSGDARDALVQLRRECVDAKEALSFDTEVTIPVVLPTVTTKIRLTRAEFEAMIEEHLDGTVAALDEAVESAGVGISDVDAIVLVGGSSRIPRVAQRLSELFDRPIVLDQDPKSSTAMGAARGSLSRRGAMVPAASAALALRNDSTALEVIPTNDDTGGVAVSDAADDAHAVPRTRWWSKMALAAVAVAGAVMIGGTLVGEIAGGEQETAPQAAALQDFGPAVTSPSPTGTPVESGTGEVPDPDPVQEQQPPPPAGAPDPVIQREVVERHVTTETRTTVTATAPSGVPNTPTSVLPPSAKVQPPTSKALPPTPKAKTPTSQSSAPKTRATTPKAQPTPPRAQPTTPKAQTPTTPAPDPTTPAPAPTTPATDPTTPAPEPTNPAPDPTTTAPEGPTAPAEDTTPEPALISETPTADPAIEPF